MPTVVAATVHQRSHGRLRSATVANAIAGASGSGAYPNWSASYRLRTTPQPSSASTGLTRRSASGRHCPPASSKASHAGCICVWYGSSDSRLSAARVSASAASWTTSRRRGGSAAYRAAARASSSAGRPGNRTDRTAPLDEASGAPAAPSAGTAGAGDPAGTTDGADGTGTTDGTESAVPAASSASPGAG